MLYEKSYILFVFLMSIRYFILTGLSYFIFYKILKSKVVRLKIQQKFPLYKDYVREIKHSILTLFIFAGYAYIILNTKLRGFTKIYDDIHQFSALYFILSILIALFIHDTYFYFMHRIMHHPKIFKHVHLVHHKSTNPNPFSSYSFHPIEAIIEGAVIIVIAITIPIHKLALGIFLLVMILYNIYGHLGYEIIPNWIRKSKIGKWLNTATNHNLHHKLGKDNYGLYFKFWDEIFKTSH